MAKKGKLDSLSQFDAALANIRQNKISVVSLLYGSEDFMINALEDEILKASLSEEEKAFNLNVFYGRDADYSNLLSSLKRYPMMASRQVVILREAKDFKELQKLSDYIESPSPTTIFIISHKNGSPDLRKAFAKACKKHFIFEADHPSEISLANYIKNRLNKENIKIEEDALIILQDHLGNDLSKVMAILDKLLANKNSNESITRKDIEEHVGINREYNIFELQDALVAKNKYRALAIVNYFIEEEGKAAFFSLIPTLFSFFSRALAIKDNLGKSNEEIASKIGVSSGAVYMIGKRASAFERQELINAIQVLEDVDLTVKGFNTRYSDEKSLAYEMLGRLLN